MERRFIYKGMSKIYDLLDVLYFKNIESSPRKAVYDSIDPNDVKILDVCTGTAANAIRIAKLKKDTQVVGIDISNEMLRIAEKKVKKNGLNNLKLFQMDATETTFHDETFDVILISLVLHEISVELAEKLVLEAKRILKPKGKILVVEWEEPQNTLKKALFYPIKKMEPKGFDKFLNINMVNYFEKYGLEIKEIKHCDYSKVLLLKKVNPD